MVPSRNYWARCGFIVKCRQRGNVYDPVRQYAKKGNWEKYAPGTQRFESAGAGKTHQGITEYQPSWYDSENGQTQANSWRDAQALHLGRSKKRDHRADARCRWRGVERCWQRAVREHTDHRGWAV